MLECIWPTVAVLTTNIPTPVYLVQMVVVRRTSLPNDPLHLVVERDGHILGGIWYKVGHQGGRRWLNAQIVTVRVEKMRNIF